MKAKHRAAFLLIVLGANICGGASIPITQLVNVPSFVIWSVGLVLVVIGGSIID